MAVKFDKDMILKHRFWVMLGVSVTLVLVGILILTFSESDAYDKLKTALKNTVTPDANPETIKVATEDAKNYQGKKADVWKAAYDAQAVGFTWPKPVEDRYD